MTMAKLAFVAVALVAAIAAAVEVADELIQADDTCLESNCSLGLLQLQGSKTSSSEEAQDNEEGDIAEEDAEDMEDDEEGGSEKCCPKNIDPMWTGSKVKCDVGDKVWFYSCFWDKGFWAEVTKCKSTRIYMKEHKSWGHWKGTSSYGTTTSKAPKCVLYQGHSKYH
eukprot:TRINITY_DN34359_c0_g1_i1.p1 TRINITY_DN34359_c0_g1~~TRINITY_DN34359_c0_g1_i1.p1  ORF type:complete len:167 (+),score=40.01 TRINITY_DN34359_c0_g1_i1:57-557(+)